MQHVRIGAARHETSHQRGLEHIARTARVLAKNNTGLFIGAGPVVPAHKAPDLECVINIEALVGLATESIGSEVLQLHFSLLFDFGGM